MDLWSLISTNDQTANRPPNLLAHLFGNLDGSNRSTHPLVHFVRWKGPPRATLPGQTGTTRLIKTIVPTLKQCITSTLSITGPQTTLFQLPQLPVLHHHSHTTPTPHRRPTHPTLTQSLQRPRQSKNLQRQSAIQQLHPHHQLQPQLHPRRITTHSHEHRRAAAASLPRGAQGARH